MLTRAQATTLILKAKEAKGITFQRLAEHVGRDPVWTTAALLGQMQMSTDEADAVVKMLELPDEVSAAFERHPAKGSLDAAVPVDPLTNRFYEIVQVDDTTLKALIHEKFGDSILSAIDFEMHVERKSERATASWKFLPYRRW